MSAATLSLSTRASLPGAREDRLYFAQVREDPRLELEAIRPGPGDHLVVVSSGGCTALSLLAAGAGKLTGVDLNATQNHLVELKALAAARLAREEALAFLGAVPCGGLRRASLHASLRAELSPGARGYWDARPGEVADGVLGCGVSERFLRGVARGVEALVHPRARIDRLLACSTVEEQRDLYHREWDGWRWRLLFRLVAGRRALTRTYHPAFFAHLERPSFAEHFRARVEHTLTRLPVADNYFLHHLLAGRYPVEREEGVPPYLSPAGAARLPDRLHDLTLVDGSVTDHLRTLPDGSVHAFSLSNVCEWLTPAQVDDLFAQVVRTAAPGARLCFRNFVGWTEVPERWRGVVVEDRARGEALMETDRSLVQRRFAVCTVGAR